MGVRTGVGRMASGRMAGAAVALALLATACAGTPQAGNGSASAPSASSSAASSSASATASSSSPFAPAAASSTATKLAAAETPCPTKAGPQYPVYSAYAWKADATGLLVQPTKAGESEAFLRCGTGWEDYTFTAQYEAVNGGFAEFIMRAYGTDNYMMADIKDASPPSISYWPRVNGGYTNIKGGGAIAVKGYKPGTWHTFKMVISGSTFTPYIDGVKGAPVTYPLFYRGTVGVRYCCNRQWYTRDWTVTAPSGQVLFSTKTFAGVLGFFTLPQG